MPLRTGIASLGRGLAGSALRSLRDDYAPIFGHGMLCGCFALTCLQQTISCFGTSPPVSMAMLTSVAIGASLAFGRSRIGGEPTSGWLTSRRLVSAGLLVGLAMWTNLHPLWLDGAMWIASRANLVLDSSASAACFVAAVTLLGLGLPAWILTRLIRSLCDELHSRPVMEQRSDPQFASATASMLIGIGIGVVLSGLWLAPRWGLELTSLATTAVAAAWATRRAVLPISIAIAGPLPGEVSPVREPSAVPMARICSTGSRYVAASMALACGGLLAVWLRMSRQLVPQTSLAMASDLGTIAISLGAGIAFVRWTLRRGSCDAGRLRMRIAATLAAWSLVVPAVFPLLADGSLWLNAFVSHPSLITLGRAGLTASLLAPAAFAFGILAASETHPTRWRIVLATWLAMMSFCVSAFTVTRAVNPVVVSLCLSGALLAVVALNWRRIAITPLSPLQCLGWGLAVALLPSSQLWVDMYSPAMTARMLFNTNVAVARRAKLDREQLLHLDEGRLLAVREGSRGTYTVWKHNGRQVQLRENGIPVGVQSLDAEVLPQYAGEVLPAALPLVLHEAPLRAMVLGLGTGEALRAVLDFPLQHVVCVEPDRELIRLVREIPSLARLGAGDEVDSFHDELSLLRSSSDDRLRFRCVDHALAVLGSAADEEYDVIVSNPDHSFLARSAACFTSQFYERVADRLSARGVFSQRMQMLDYGPVPLQSIVATLQSVFREVASLEVTPGELVLLATNDERGFVRPPLSARLTAPHVRTLLARVGIDWSSLLSFGGYSHDTLAKFAANGNGHINRVSSSRLAFSMPCEVLRWGAKLPELQASLNGQGSTLAMWLGDAEDLSEAFRRQRDVAEQVEVMSTFADQYWAYRSRVKELITKRPESAIRPVKFEPGGQRAVPDSARRLKYFEALGRAAQSKATADIDRVAEFESPYDPLISYFLHQEVAELLANATPREPARELRYRWHALYFSSVNDHSVRNVCDAIDLLLDHPEAAPTALQRRDDLDALLQLLATRWQLRIGMQPKSTQTMLRDIDVSLRTAERACDALARLTNECGLSPAEWASRRAAIQQLLVRPVRDYREKLLPIHQKNVARARALQSSD